MTNILYILLVGFIISVIWFVVGGVLYMNPIVAKIYKGFEDHPSMKKWSSQKKYMINMYLLGILIPSLITTFVYLALSPISTLFFGLMLAGVRIVPRFFDMYMQSSYPNKLLYVEIVNGTILSFLVAVALSWLL